MMERQDILHEYFSLVKDLNQTNKFKNEQTQIVFEIEYQVNGQGVLFAMIYRQQKIMLCHQGYGDVWRVNDNSRYLILSDWLIQLLRIYNDAKLKLKMTFDDYFNQKFQELLAFKD
jgi:predicted metal-binding protein